MEKKIWEYRGNRSDAVSLREQKHAALAESIAEKAVVLLKNEGVLPLSEQAVIALFGAGADHTVKGGIGSGDVNNRESVSIYQGLRNRGVRISSERWRSEYAEIYEQARRSWRDLVMAQAKVMDNPFYAYAENPFSLPEGGAILEEDLAGAECILYVISRIAGEGKDRRLEEGDYYLSRREQEELQQLNSFGLPIVLLLNAGGPVEITGILASCENIRGVLQLSQLGQEGGNAVAAILLGEAVPEGKLTASWARSYEDYPYGLQFGRLGGDLSREEYREGVFVGYRYFDSFGLPTLYPFGFGLSYTSFEIEACVLRWEGAQGILTVRVKNTGKRFSGREVVQVYLYLPQDGSSRERKRLAAFQKTSLLAPGEQEELEIRIDRREFTVFSEEKHGLLIPEGSFGLGVGSSSENDRLCFLLQAEKEGGFTPTEKLDFPEQYAFSHEQPAFTMASYENMQKNEAGLPVYDFPAEFFEGMDTEERIAALSVNDGAQEAGKAGEISEEPWKTLAADGEISALLPLFYGSTEGAASNLGAAGIQVPGSAGETTGHLSGQGYPPVVMADGPAGLRLQQHYEVNPETGEVYGLGVLGSLENGYLAERENHPEAESYYQFCTAFPVGTAMAQTWEPALFQAFGDAVAEEMQEYHVQLWLAPGLNIQRNPLCGRNFEYYSEDPFLSGHLAAAVTRGVQQHSGCGVTIKHFAANNQEDNRMGVNACIEEKALREIYLRGFEIAVKEGAPIAVMSSYNLVNGVHAANSFALCTQVLRQEWGYQGIVMSDWATTLARGGSTPWRCVQAGNDIIMPGNVTDAENIREAYEKGLLSEAVIRECAGRILRMIRRLHG